MKRWWLPIAFIVLAYLVAREFRSPEPAPAPAVLPPTSKAKDKPSLPTSSPPVTAPNHKPTPAVDEMNIVKPLPPSTPGETRPKPPPNSIPFELYQGLVIAYGDQLLGRPTAENFPESGFIDAPKLNLWINGEIPYSFDPKLINPERVQRVIAYFNQFTPVRFVPLTNQKDSIVFTPSEVPLCLSYLGRIGGHQPIYLDHRCLDHEVTHEIMHALGFIHEHSRPDRDQFVRIHWDRIEDDKQGQFEAAPASLAKPLSGRPFDHQSVMIYDPTSFAKQRGEQTIESLSGARIEPTTQGLSTEDIARLVVLYGR